ncbi:MAG: carboxypeptidase-like regulatory domain-containing protein [Saprospiraceae bacterium]|nr:carboxypeptidase-like regulatory domain-containing protein [Saprospiraceae bacterium]
MVLGLFLGLHQINAQDGIIRGSVIDDANGDPIGFATVRVQGSTIGVNTDLDGFFSITGLSEGNYKLIVTSGI